VEGEAEFVELRQRGEGFEFIVGIEGRPGTGIENCTREEEFAEFGTRAQLGEIPVVDDGPDEVNTCEAEVAGREVARVVDPVRGVRHPDPSAELQNPVGSWAIRLRQEGKGEKEKQESHYW